MRASKLLAFTLAAFITAAFAPRVEAQNLAQMYQVSPAEGADLAAAIAQHAEWREANGDPWTWQVYEVVQGEDLGDFYIRSGGHAWADFDAYEESTFEQSAAEHYASTMAPAVGEITSWISATDTTHQRYPDSMESIELFQVIIWHLKPDKTQDYQDAIDKFHNAIAQTDWPVHYAFISPVVGLDGPQGGLVIFNENWASMAGPEQSFDQMMGEVYGEEAAEIFQKFSGSFHAEESFVLRLRPDLSVNLGG